MELSSFRNLFGELQTYVAAILNEDETLSAMGARFSCENSLDIEYEAKTALAKQGLACIVMTPAAKYQGHNAIQQTFSCEELTLQIVENPPVNRARLKKDGLEHGTALDVAKAASDRLAGPQGGHFGKFTTKNIRESEQGGLLVCTVTFGCTVYENLSAVISGDLSGHWVEVPFVRVSDLSSWLSSWISANVDLEPYREKTDLSTYTEQWASWTFDGDRELTYDGFDDRLQSYVWSYRRGLSLGWRHLTYFAGDEQYAAGWYVSIGEMPNLTNFIGGEWNDLVLDVPESLQTQWGEQITRPYVGGLMPDGDRFALSSELADLSVQFGGMIDTKRGKGDLSVYSETEPYVPTGDMIAKMSDIPDVPYINYNKFRQKDDLSTYTKITPSWFANPETPYGAELTWRPQSEWWCNNADVSAEWDAGTVVVKWDGEKWIGLGDAIYEWVDMGSTDPHATELTLDLRPGGYDVFHMTRSGYDDIYTPDGDRLALSSEVAALYTNDEIDVMMGKKRGLSDLNVYSDTEPYTPTGDVLATKSLVAETSASLSAKLMLKDWQNYVLSSEWDNGMTMIRTYDGVQHWVTLSTNTIINQTIFNNQGFNYTNDPLSGIMEVAFGRGLFPYNTINMAGSKVKHVWYPSQLSTMGQNGFNNCLELETVLMADYSPAEMAKTLRINYRAFRLCPKLSRVELPALSVVADGSSWFESTPLSAQSEWPDLEPGLWLYGWMKGETDAKQNLSALLGLPEDVIHVGYPRKEDSGEYLPLSGGTMTGELAFNVPNKGASIFDGETLRLDPGALSETSVTFPLVGGQHDVAYKDLTWQKTDNELSVGVGRYKAYVEPGELLAMDEGGGGPDPQKKTQYMWDGMVYTVIDNSGPTPVTNNYTLMYPTAGGTLATREWTEYNKVQNVNGVAGIMSAEVSAWADLSAEARENRLYVLVDA